MPPPLRPTWRFAVNFLTLFGVLVAGGWWLARYTTLFAESGTVWVLSAVALGVGGTVIGSLTKLIPEEWVKGPQAWLSAQLAQRSIFWGVWGAFVVGGVVSLWFGALRVKDQSGAASLRAAVYPEGGPPAEAETWEPKSPLHRTRCTRPGGARRMVVAIEGAPKRSFALTPWFRDGEFELEYPRDFLRPVVLITVEKHLVDKAEKDPGSLRLGVTVTRPDGSGTAECAFDGHAVWVGCEAADKVAVPEERAGADWRDDPRFDRYVKHPQDKPGLSRPLDPDVTVAVVLYEDGKRRELKPPADVRTARPNNLAEMVQVLTLYLK